MGFSTRVRAMQSENFKSVLVLDWNTGFFICVKLFIFRPLFPQRAKVRLLYEMERAFGDL